MNINRQFCPMPTTNTVDKVAKFLAAQNTAMSQTAIQRALEMNWHSIGAALNYLAQKGKVKCTTKKTAVVVWQAKTRGGPQNDHNSELRLFKSERKK